MKPMKTLTVNGVTYTVYDPTAPRIDDTVVGDAPWSAKKIVDTLCPAFTERGALVTCQPVAGYPLEVAAEAAVTRCGKNLFDFTQETREVSHINAGGSINTRMGFAISLPAGTYTLHAEEKVPSTTDWYLYGAVTKGDGTYQESCSLRVGAVNNTRTVTLEPGGMIYIYHGYTTPTAQQLKDLFTAFDIQMEAGGTATAFAAYCGETFAAGEPVPALPGVNTLWADSGEITVTGRGYPWQ